MDEQCVSELPGVGEVRSAELAEMGVETVGELVELTPDQVSMWTEMSDGIAFNVWNTAQKAVRGELEDDEEESDDTDEQEAEETDDQASESPGVDNPRLDNVLIFGNEERWSERSEEAVNGLIETALERYDVRPRKVGWLAGDQAGSYVEKFVKARVRSDDDSETVGRKEFEPDEVGHRGLDGEVNWRAAFQERDERAFEWADAVVIVEEDEYTDYKVNVRLEEAPGRPPNVFGPFIPLAEDDETDEAQMELDTFGDEGDETVEDEMSDNTRDLTREEAEHRWIADQERDQPSEYEGEGGEPGDKTLL